MNQLNKSSIRSIIVGRCVESGVSVIIRPKDEGRLC